MKGKGLHPDMETFSIAFTQINDSGKFHGIKCGKESSRADLHSSQRPRPFRAELSVRTATSQGEHLNEPNLK